MKRTTCVKNNRLASLSLLAKASVAALVACTAISCGPRHGSQGSFRTAEIPITRVVLYQNGVGYFERKGKINGDVLTLQIRPSQINDLLKSLTVIDRTEGRAVSVSLPLDKTGEQILSELPEQVRNVSGLLGVLRVFRGARVTVDGDQGSVSGRIVGVENMQQGAKGEDAKADWKLTIKTDDNELRVYPVDDITRIDLEDRTLSVGLDQSLDVSLNEGNWKPIALSVWLVGKSKHELEASYIVEMPRWKPAYRIVVGEEDLLLQGWAVVDNVSGEDWNNVELSLVAGTPMSFIYDLHTPQFTRRTDLTPRGRSRAIAPPRELAGTTKGDRLEREIASTRAKKSMSRPAPSRAPRPDSNVDGFEDDEMLEEEESDKIAEAFDASLEQQAQARVEGSALGSLFRYDLKDKVTVPDRSSTLVAIVNQRVSGQEVVLFRPELTRRHGSSHPYRAVMFKNDSGFTLEKGPVTVYSAGTFVGEGFVERMEQAATSLISFSVDGNVSMASKNGSSQEGLRLLRIIDGVLMSEVLEITSTTYTVENRHPTPITAYFKTARRQGWTLQNQPGGTVETPDALLVPVTVPANGKADLKVAWAKKVERRSGIDTGLATSVLRIYMKSGKAPPAIAKKLDQVLVHKRRIDEIDRDVRRFEKLHRDLSKDQNRVRKNLKLLGKTQGNLKLRRELENKLAAQERELGKHSAAIVRLSEERATHVRQMNVIIRTVTLLDAEK